METITTASGIVLEVSTQTGEGAIEVVVEKKNGPACVLHWGLLRSPGGRWQAPPQSALPPGSTAAAQAVETPLAGSTDRVTLRLDPTWRFSSLALALFDPKTARWDSNQGRNYGIALPPPPPLPRTAAEAARSLLGKPASARELGYELDEGCTLAVAVAASETAVELAIATDVLGPLTLHWGTGARRYDWHPPTPAELPAGTRLVDARAAQASFADERDLRTLHLQWPPGTAPAGLCFVLHQPDPDHWWNDRGRNFFVRLGRGPGPSPFADANLAGIADEIIDHEMGGGSWTLMHRFGLAWELLDRIPAGSAAGLALLFVWLRFSAIRQLDWQRNYNTKPRELAHAQDRLTLKLAERVAQAGEQRPLVRMLAGTLGRGGDGQRVRDGILEIMHRHHVKEVAGRFLEEWHQKLHNNTTPDDVVICEAYLEFLRHQGDLGLFYRTLAAAGVSKARLESYERPIRSQPEYMADLRDALLHDFGEFLAVLRQVHSATDFRAAMQAAHGSVDDATRGALDEIWRRRDDAKAATSVLEMVTRTREALAGQIRPGRTGLRDIVYLDLSLEALLRTVVEGHLHEPRATHELLAWTELAVRNLLCVRRNAELAFALAHLRRLLPPRATDRSWALHVQAVVERMRRAVVAISDEDFRLLQPIAEYLGGAFQAAAWSISGFAEEVLRGRIEFVLSAVLRKLDEGLRAIAKASDWQLTSRGAGRIHGRVESVDALGMVESRRFEASTILVADGVAGSEEIPAGVVAVLTASTVDLMSHLAVRARNAGVMLATCSTAERLAGLRAEAGQWLRLSFAPDGEIVVEAAEAGAASSPAAAARIGRPAPRPTTTALAIGPEEFSEANVGAKSRNLERLRGKLPATITVPRGIAVPYGACERVLADSVNHDRAHRYHELVSQLAQDLDGQLSGVLAKLRELVAALEPPAGLEAALRDAMNAIGMPPPPAFGPAWQCIARVWASKWNDRAYLSRRQNGISDDDVHMAVLIQEVVPAEYAFVIHTVDPLRDKRDELVAEMVLGLGESLVGNQPGRAFGFRWQRARRDFEVTSFPSKSMGLFGEGWMFRSDSSGEDLADLAGAGLYDSLMLPEPRALSLDYTKAEILWDDAARRRLVEGIADLGVAVEGALGGPQDIEGAFGQGRFSVVQARPQVGLDHG